MRLLAAAKGTRIGDEARAGLRRFLDVADKSVVPHRDISLVQSTREAQQATATERVAQNHLLHFPRTDLKRLVQTYQPEDDRITLGDIVCYGISS